MAKHYPKGVTMGNLKQVRTGFGFSRTELAEITGISPDTLARYERGDSSPNKVYATVLATALGVPIHELTNPNSVVGLVI